MYGMQGTHGIHEIHGTCEIFESRAIEISGTREIHGIQEIEEMHGLFDVQILDLIAGQSVALSLDQSPREWKRRS